MRGNARCQRRVVCLYRLRRGLSRFGRVGGSLNRGRSRSRRMSRRGLNGQGPASQGEYRGYRHQRDLLSQIHLSDTSFWRNYGLVTANESLILISQPTLNSGTASETPSISGGFRFGLSSGAGWVP